MDGLSYRATALPVLRSLTDSPQFERGPVTDAVLPPIGVATKDGIAWIDAASYEITVRLHLWFSEKSPKSEGRHNHTDPLYVIVYIGLDPSRPELNHGIVCGNNPILYVDPSGHLFGIDDLTIGVLIAGMLKGAAIGAAVGATVSAVTGGDIGKGALTGAISGAFFGGAGTIIQTGGLEGVVVAKVAIHSAAGAISSGINASITGGNIGIEMGIGAVSAGMGSFAGHYLPKDLLIQTGARSLIGGLSGGVAAELYGGNFGRGFQSGAVTAGIGALANEYHNIFFDWFGNTAVPWLREQYRNFVGGEKAYADLTITFPIPVFPFLMGSGSFLTESNGTYYIQGCIGFGTGFGVSITGSPSTPVPGYFIAGQGSFIKTAQLGYSFAPNGGWFFEGGVTRPMAGWSFLGCRVFGPFGN